MQAFWGNAQTEGTGAQACAHREEAILNVLAQDACQRLEHLPHGAVANHDDAPALQALAKELCVHRLQLAPVWPEDLVKLMQQELILM